MKKRKGFYRNGGLIYLAITALVITECFLIGFLIDSIMKIDKVGILILSISAIIIPIVGLCLALVNANFALSKIYFSEEGIECLLFKKFIMLMKWDDITKIESRLKWKIRGGGIEYIDIYIGQDKFDIIAAKNMIKTMFMICPHQNLKNQIKQEFPFI